MEIVYFKNSMEVYELSSEQNDTNCVHIVVLKEFQIIIAGYIILYLNKNIILERLKSFCTMLLIINSE